MFTVVALFCETDLGTTCKSEHASQIFPKIARGFYACRTLCDYLTCLGLNPNSSPNPSPSSGIGPNPNPNPCSDHHPSLYPNPNSIPFPGSGTKSELASKYFPEECPGIFSNYRICLGPYISPSLNHSSGTMSELAWRYFP